MNIKIRIRNYFANNSKFISEDSTDWFDGYVGVLSNAASIHVSLLIQIGDLFGVSL